MTATLIRTPTSTLRPRVDGTFRERAAATPPTDEELLARVGRGDAAAWGELYRRHRGTVTGYVRNRVPANADVEDLVHEGFLLARDMAGDYRLGEQGYTVRAWLCGRAGQAIRQNAWSSHAYLLAADASRTAMREPVTEPAAERERQPLSEPVLHALAQLPPAQRRAIQLRYLDGLSEGQAAEVGQCTPRSIRSSAEVARRKLRTSLAELTPEARSPLQGMPRHEAARLALATVGDGDVEGAQAWLRERGVRVGTTTMYEVRRDPDRPRTVKQDPPAYATLEQIRALPPMDRARAAGRDYRSHYDQLPSISQLAAATGVSNPTASRALRQLKAEHQTDQQSQPVDADDRAHHRAGVERSASTSAHQPATAAPPAERDDQRQAALPDPSAQHRVSVHSQAVHSPPKARPATSHHGTSQRSAPAREHDAGEEASDPAPAEVSIARARVALDVLSAHRTEQDKRRSSEQARTEQLNRWHHDDHHDQASTGRAATRSGRADHGEGHTR
jgi:RNA polymerase sigma-70 factor (ECF subfamily)